MSNIPVVILAGGRGSRLERHTDLIPKPMVKIQGKPIVERIIDNFRSHGFDNFIISSGYKSSVIENHFFGRRDIKVVNTGESTQTAGRILGVADEIKSDIFMACYGDIITNADPAEMMKYHRVNYPACTMLAVHPRGRFGELEFSSSGRIDRFSEKPVSDRWINGGYFCFSTSVFGYIESDKDVLEKDVFQKAMHAGSLYAHSFDGFWHSVDTQKDIAELNEMELP